MQLIAILVLLPLSAHLPSPTDSPRNEWDACSKPLGAWNAIWTVRVVVDLVLAYTTFTQQRRKRMNPTTCVMSAYIAPLSDPNPNAAKRRRQPRISTPTQGQALRTRDLRQLRMVMEHKASRDRRRKMGMEVRAGGATQHGKQGMQPQGV